MAKRILKFSFDHGIKIARLLDSCKTNKEYLRILITLYKHKATRMTFAASYILFSYPINIEAEIRELSTMTIAILCSFSYLCGKRLTCAQVTMVASLSSRLVRTS